MWELTSPPLDPDATILVLLIVELRNNKYDCLVLHDTLYPEDVGTIKAWHLNEFEDDDDGYFCRLS